MKNNPIFSREVPKSAKGYSAFPMDNLANFTSVCGYLLPVYWDFLEPGDKVTCQTKLRTRTQPFAKPAMATICERIEWFAVPIEQLYKWFGAKFYGINDTGTDLLLIADPQITNVYMNSYIPYVTLDDLETMSAFLPSQPITQIQLSYNDYPTKEEFKRLCDCMGLPRILGQRYSASDSWNMSINLLPFAAYQKIYSDHYRLTDREMNDPTAYNLDSFAGNQTYSANVPVAANLAANARLNKLFKLRLRPYMKDYFTSMQVSPLFGSQDTNAIGNDIGAINQWLSGLTSVKTASPATISGLTSGGGVTGDDISPSAVRVPASSPTAGGAAAQFNPSNIRSMFAVEKLLEVTRAAKKHYDMQTLAHFGVEVPKGLSGECFKLGTHEQFIQIGDVVSTSDTATTGSADGKSLGALAGTGASNATSEKVHFEAKCHCILMAIYSAEPIVNVVNNGLDRKLARTKTDEFYKSEFDNLGMQPLFKYELHLQPEGNGNNTSGDVLGWQYRYAEQKAKYNRTFGGCATTYFSEWSLNREDINNLGISTNFFKVWPTDLNNILYTHYDGNQSYATAYSTDYLINQIYFDVVKSSKKSIYGIPNL